MSIPTINLRKIDRKRLDNLQERATNDLDYTDIWYMALQPQWPLNLR